MRLEEPEEAWLGGRLPISRLIQCSHKEELVDPKERKRHWLNIYNTLNTAHLNVRAVLSLQITSHRTVGRP